MVKNNHREFSFKGFKNNDQITNDIFVTLGSFSFVLPFENKECIFFGSVLNGFNDRNNAIENILRKLFIPLHFWLHEYAHLGYVVCLKNV